MVSAEGCVPPSKANTPPICTEYHGYLGVLGAMWTAPWRSAGMASAGATSTTEVSKYTQTHTTSLKGSSHIFCGFMTCMRRGRLSHNVSPALRGWQHAHARRSQRSGAAEERQQKGARCVDEEGHVCRCGQPKSENDTRRVLSHTVCRCRGTSGCRGVKKVPAHEQKRYERRCRLRTTHQKLPARVNY